MCTTEQIRGDPTTNIREQEPDRYRKEKHNTRQTGQTRETLTKKYTPTTKRHQAFSRKTERSTWNTYCIDPEMVSPVSLGAHPSLMWEDKCQEAHDVEVHLYI